MGISESRKSKAGNPLIVSKTRQTQRRPKAKLHRHPIRISALNLPRRQFLHLAAGAAALPAMPRVSRAQAFPSRPVTMIVPSAAGGGLDAVGRMLAERMRALLGQPVVIENVGGGGGSIGVGRAARAAGDGYTVILGSWATFVANGVAYALPYNLLTDFKPIALVTTQPILIVAKKVRCALSD